MQPFKHKWFNFVLACFCVGAVFAQDHPLRVNLDLAQFQDAQERDYVEIYYSLSGVPESYVLNDEGKLVSQLLMTLQMFKDDSLWASKLWKVEDTQQDTSSMEMNRQMLDMFRYELDEPGIYRARILVKDMNNQSAVDSVDKVIVARQLASSELDVSDVELASSIQRKDEQSSAMFVRSNYEVTPNPAMIFGDNLKSMYYYFEAYNLQQGLQGAKYKSIAYLKDNNGQVLDQIATASRIKKKVADTGVEMGMINVGTLPSGTYSFVYGVSDTNDKKVVTAEKKVFIYNPDVAMTTQASSRADGDQALLSELGNLSGKDIDSEYESMIYLTSKEERDFYKNLTNDDGKRQIIYSTWADKMSDEGLTGMAYRTLYKQRTVQANESFKEPGKVGWKTDRGRVFILYGPPTNVERFPSTAANKPYQTWRYDNLRGQGGVEFVFADRFGFNKYELVHSTLRGELQDPFWERFVLVGPQDAIRSN